MYDWIHLGNVPLTCWSAEYDYEKSYSQPLVTAI